MKKLSGFTLIELLLGLSISAVIGLCVFSTFSAGVRLEGRSEIDSEVFKEARISLDLIERELTQAVPYDFSASYEDKSAFIGETDKVTFLYPDEKGLSVISYYLKNADDGFIKKTIIGQKHAKNVTVRSYQSANDRVEFLVREKIPFVDFLSGKDPSNDSKEIISANVKKNSLSIKYLYLKDDGTDETYWDEAWDGNGMPSGVKIDFELVSRGKNRNIRKFTKDIFIPTGKTDVKKDKAAEEGTF